MEELPHSATTFRILLNGEPSRWSHFKILLIFLKARRRSAAKLPFG